MIAVWEIVGFPMQLLIAEWLYAWLFKRRSKFVLRAVCCVAVFLAFAALLWWITDYITSVKNVTLGGMTYSFQFPLLFAASVFIIYICFDCFKLEAVFCGIFGYAVQNLMYQLSIMFTVPLGLKVYTVTNAAVGACIMLLTYLIVWAVFCRRAKNAFTRVNNKKVIAVGMIFLIISIALNSQIQSMEMQNSINVRTRSICAAFAAMGCMLTLFVLKGFYDESKLRDEKIIIDSLLTKTADRSQMASENIETINRKCHDLKYQIRALKSMSSEERNEAIAELETAVMFYELDAKTNNAALDTILTEKVMYCKNNGIELTYMVDGEALSVLKTEDIYSLFGNVLDNAIEAELKITDRSKRHIGLNVYRENGFLSINIVNYYPFEVDFADGKPKTSKEDKNSHGFGIKSVLFIVKKYKGHVVIKKDGDLFKVSALIPT